MSQSDDKELSSGVNTIGWNSLKKKKNVTGALKIEIKNSKHMWCKHPCLHPLINE